MYTLSENKFRTKKALDELEKNIDEIAKKKGYRK